MIFACYLVACITRLGLDDVIRAVEADRHIPSLWSLRPWLMTLEEMAISSLAGWSLTQP
jgi:hypothetical protein